MYYISYQEIRRIYIRVVSKIRFKAWAHCLTDRSGIA